MNRPYSAEKHGSRFEIRIGNTTAFYHESPELGSEYNAKKIARMLNDAREAGYKDAKRELREWFGL